MDNPYVILVWFLGILSVLGIIGILIRPLLRDKEEPEA
jgi:hypothetical protein